MARRKPRYEIGIETSVDGYARQMNYLSRKMNGAGNRSWPDRMYLGPRQCWFIEFKRPRKVPTVQQALLHYFLRALGFEVFVIDDVAVGKRVVDRMARIPTRQQWADWKQDRKEIVQLFAEQLAKPKRGRPKQRRTLGVQDLLTSFPMLSDDEAGSRHP